jgi:hypothetical protein
MHYAQLRIPALVRMLALTALFAIHALAVTEKVLYAFHGPGDGSLPSSNLIFDKAGNLYGTTSAGGSAACDNYYGIFGCGTVFKLSPNPDGSWTETVLYSFQGGLDGISPGNIIFDKAGNIYGTTWGGGVSTCYGGCGTVFKLSRSHGVWTESVLYRFQGGSNGHAPTGIILDALGNVYGATYYGGISTCNYTNFGCGVLFELSPSGSGVWIQTILHTFGVTTIDGQNPNGGLVFDRKGSLFGSTNLGGTALVNSGTIFEFTPSPSGWNETILYSFNGGSAAGCLPAGGVIFGPGGRLYGSAYGGGIYGSGAFFEAGSGAKGWGEAVILPFGGNTAGMNPAGLLSTDSSGNLYGTTEYGGGGTGLGSGTVYKMTPNSNGWTGTLIYAFSGGADGGIPLADVVVDSTGNIYGTARVGGLGDCDPYYGPGCGVVFEITP